MKKRHYWFKVSFGKWDEDTFEVENSSVYVEAWDASHAIRKATSRFEQEDGELPIGVECLGYPQ